MGQSSSLYPLKFEPIYKEKVWGGRSLERLGRPLPGGADTLIGESWELADLGQTSASGGGGGSERSVIANGHLAGATLHDVMTERGSDLMGGLEPNNFGEFPLLLKFLDARENLSVQVHPSPEYAATHPDAFLKSEAWYIVDAEPGAVIYKGVKEGTSEAQFRDAIARNDVEPLLLKVPVQAGDCHYLPSGTCHALGAGVVVAEVQTPSDTTFRVYDWGRTGRELHLDQAMRCIHFGPPEADRYERRSRIVGQGTTLTHLVRCEHFRIDRIDAQVDHFQSLAYDQPAVWMVVRGHGIINPENAERVAKSASIGKADQASQSVPEVELGPLETIYIPPATPPMHVRFDEPTTWLEITFPQAEPTRIA